MATNPKIRYDIEAAVSGGNDVGALANQLEGLANTLEGDLKVQALASAQALRTLGEKQGAIQSFRQLKTEVQDASGRLREAQSAAQQLGQRIGGMEAPTRAQAGQLQKLRDTVRAAKSEVQSKTVALDQSRAALSKYGVGTNSLAQSERSVRAAISEVRSEVRALAPTYTAAGSAAAESGRKQAQATATAGAGVRGLGAELDKVDAKSSLLNTSLSSVGKAVAGLFALNKAKSFATDTIALADAYGQMAERISMATPQAEEYEMVQQRILATANLTYRRLDEQQELYIRTADALRDMSYSTSEALDITDSFSFLLTTNAASAERGKNAIDAYTKSIQSGRIEVSSWQSIMAATPTIVNAVAVATGKTAEEVRRLGITGKLAIGDLNEGLRQTVELNKEAAAGMSATVSDAVTRLTNTWTQYVGEANRATQSTQKIVSAIDMLSENLDTVVSLAITAGEVMAVVWGIKGLNALKAYTAQLAVASTQTTALMAATTAAGSKMATALAAAGKLAAAGWVGWEIGTYLRSEFEVVEKAGIALAAGLTKTTARIQGAWESAKAVFSDDTIEAAQKRLAERLAEIDDNYADLFANVGKGSEQAAKDTQRFGDQVRTLDGDVERLGANGKSAADALEEIGKKANLLDNAGIQTFTRAVYDLGVQGKASGDQIREAFSNALKGEDLAAFEDRARLALAGTKDEAEQLAVVLDATLREAIRRSGADFAVISGGMGAAARSAINDTGLIINNLDRLKGQGVDTAAALTASLGKGISTADSSAAIEALRQQVELVRKALGDKVADGFLRDIEERAKRVVGDLGEVEKAFRKLGIVSREDLARTATEFKAAYDTVLKSGQATAEGLQTAFKKYAEAAIAANGGVATEALKSEAAMRGLDLAVDAAGKTIVRAMGESAQATERFRAGVQQSTQEVQALMGWLDRLEKRNAQVKSSQSADKEGGRPGMGGDLTTLTGISKFLEGAGLDAAQAKRLALEFSDGKGNIPYFSNAGQIKYGGRASTMSEALLKAAEQTTFGTGAGGAASIGRTVNVNLQVGGKTQTVTTDEEGAQALVSTLQQASLASRG
jgi:tape measure domain-containing protein